MVLAAKRSVGRTRMGLGPAECAMAAYFASRKQIRLLTSAVSATGFNTAEPAGGAGRIQSLRAFRRAGLIDAMVPCCNAAMVLWLDGSMARTQKE